MALTRVTTWNPGDVLTAAALNGEFNNILNNPISLISPTTGVINFNLQKHTNFVLDNQGTDPAAATTGRIFINTAQAQFKMDDGSVVRTVHTGGLGSGVQNLVGNVTTSDSAVATFSADWYLLRTTDNKASFLLNSTAPFTIDVSSSNGRDIGATIFASTFARLYVISTGAGSTSLKGIASTGLASSAGPTLPSSYSAWAYLATFPYSSASSVFSSTMYVRGNQVFYTAGPSTSLPANAETLVSLTSWVPSEALEWSGIVTHAETGKFLTLRLYTGIDWVFTPTSSAQPASTGVGWPLTVTAPNVSQGIYHLWSAAVAQTPLLSIKSYRVANGG